MSEVVPPASRGELSIRFRIVLLTLAVLGPAAAAMGWLLALDLQHARANAYDEVAILARDAGSTLEHVLQSTQTLLTRLASRPGVRALDPHVCDAVLADAFAATPEVAAVELRDLDGAPICACDAAGHALPGDAAAAWRPRAAHDEGMRASRAFASALTGRRLVMIAVPVRDIANHVVGEISASLDLLRLGDRLFSQAPRAALISVFDADRTILLRSSRAEEFVGTRPPPDSPAPVLGSEGFLEAAGGDGVARLHAYRSVRGVDWRISAGLPSDEVFGPYRASIRRTSVLGAMLVLLALLAAWRLASWITRPLVELRRTARHVAQGDHDEVRVKAFGPPELRAVMHDFNRMLDALSLSRARLQGVFDSTSEAIVTADSTHRIVFANRAAARTFGLPIERLVGAPLNELVPPRYRHHHPEQITRFGETEAKPRSMGQRPRLVALRADGTEFPIEASISHVAVGGQRLYTAVMRDLTEREKDRATFEAALASMMDAVCVCDAAGRIVTSNDAFATFHRIGRADERPLALSDLAELVALGYTDEADAAADDWPHARALRGLTAAGVECFLRHRRDGHAWVGGFSFAPLRDTEGRIFGCVVTARDITHLRQTQQELEESHAALRRLVMARDDAQEAERKRIARELHDDLQQVLGAISMESVIAASACVDGAPVASLKRIEHLAATAVQATRRIIGDLRPQILEELGLCAALESMANQFATRSGVQCRVEIGASLQNGPELDPSDATCLYRVVQEAMNNILKHAGATQATLRLVSQDDRWLCLQVQDDGRGIQPAQELGARTFGVLGMRERVMALGGHLRIQRAAGGGTLVEAAIPWRKRPWPGTVTERA